MSEQTNKKPCEDAVSREEVLILVNKWLHIDSSFNLERAISELPSVNDTIRSEI